MQRFVEAGDMSRVAEIKLRSEKAKREARNWLQPEFVFPAAARLVKQAKRPSRWLFVIARLVCGGHAHI